MKSALANTMEALPAPELNDVTWLVLAKDARFSRVTMVTMKTVVRLRI